MPLLQKEKKKIFFIHIPRTGGRSIIWFFKHNSWDIGFNDHREIIKTNDGMCLVPHLHFPYYNLLLNVEKINKFTIVRNPFDRFVSMCRFLNNDQIKELHNINFQKDFNFFIKNLFKTTFWFRPQNEFVTNDNLVWKFEDFFKKDFNKWIQNNFKIKTKIPKSFKYVRGEYDDRKKITLNSKLKRFIKSFYKKDFEVFKYES